MSKRESSPARAIRALVVATLALMSAREARAQDDAAVEVPGEDPVAAEAAAPPAWMTYTVHRVVGDGGGAYGGYTDALRAAGRYDFTREPDTLRIHASYRWTYRGEQCDEGSVERDVHAGLPDRLYVGQTDLDDYDGRTEPLAAWVWVPTDLEVGANVRILERAFTMVDHDAILTAGGEVSAIHLRATGVDVRDDAYGRFDTSFVDEYWFDGATGYFLASLYVEHDQGLFEGQSASFTWTERVQVTGASYLPGTSDEVDEVRPCRSPGATSGGAPRSEPSDADGFFAVFFGSSLCVSLAIVGGIFGALFFAIHLATRRGARKIDGRAATVRSVSLVSELTRVPTEESPHFGPLLTHFVEHALRAGERVAVVDLDDGRCVGLGIGDAEGGVSSVFAKHGDACELLRAHLGHTELFTEHRHETLPSVHEAAARAAVATLPLAYNVVETYEILELASPTSQPYDASVVSRMTEADLPAIAALSQEVHGVRGERWALAALAVGDLGFVAKLEGAVVGYAFASLVGDRARLYGNTVATAHRSKGLGRELARARLAALSALGATRVVTEVATWNVASLEVVRGLGFAKIGAMWVETSSAVRVERKLVRR